MLIFSFHSSGLSHAQLNLSEVFRNDLLMMLKKTCSQCVCYNNFVVLSIQQYMYCSYQSRQIKVILEYIKLINNVLVLVQDIYTSIDTMQIIKLYIHVCLYLLFREEYLAKIERRIKEYKINVLNEPREGKKLLVLDIDYTLFGMYIVYIEM